MSELRSEAINLIEKMPEEYLLAIVQYARRFEDKGFADEQAMFAEWERDPETYEDKISSANCGRFFYLKENNLLR